MEYSKIRIKNICFTFSNFSCCSEDLIVCKIRFMFALEHSSCDAIKSVLIPYDHNNSILNCLLSSSGNRDFNLSKFIESSIDIFIFSPCVKVLISFLASL